MSGRRGFLGTLEESAVLRMVEAGESAAELARCAGVSPAAAHYWLVRRGLGGYGCGRGRRGVRLTPRSRARSGAPVQSTALPRDTWRIEAAIDPGAWTP